MGRPRRADEGGWVFHVLNRANARMTIFDDDEDYETFERILGEAVERTRTRLLAYCVMPTHWHLVVWPRQDGELSWFVGWLTLTHTHRWHAHRDSRGSGHVDQGRFKSFPVQEDDHFLRVCRYVERNPLRSNLVQTAEQWRWCSLHRRGRRPSSTDPCAWLADWPVKRPAGWTRRVHTPETEAELALLRQSVRRGCPLGDASWTEQAVQRLGLQSTLRPQGRPRKIQLSS